VALIALPRFSDDRLRPDRMAGRRLLCSAKAAAPPGACAGASVHNPTGTAAAMQTFSLILILIAAVVASLPLARRLPWLPLPVLQIGIGAALAWPVNRGVHVTLDPDFFLLMFVPPLLFHDAMRAPKRELLQLRGAIAAMAFGPVFFTIGAFGYALHWLVPAVPLVVAFAAAAVLSPTDAVAVSSIVDEEKLPPRLLHLLEGESLLNDASGLVMFRFAVAAALTGAFSLADAALGFLRTVAVGVLVGWLCLLLARKALRLLQGGNAAAANAQVLVMLALPFLAYLLAEHLHASGVLAAVVAGLFLSRMGLYRHMGVSAKLLSWSSWETLSFTLNGLIFVFLGLQLPAIFRDVPPELARGSGLMHPLLLILALTLCLMALRFVFMEIGALLGWVRSRLTGCPSQAFDMRMRITAAVAGVRGAVTLAGALSLPLLLSDGTAFPARDLVIYLAAGVILCWLAIATLLLPRLTAGFEQGGHDAAAEELRHARARTAEAALARLDSLRQAATDGTGDSGAPSEDDSVVASLEAAYRQRLHGLKWGEEAADDETRAARERWDQLHEQCVQAEREAITRMLRSGDINDRTGQLLFRELTLQQAAVQTKRQQR
jgi:CPA1 family monovalent cation:H+ antiporter